MRVENRTGLVQAKVGTTTVWCKPENFATRTAELIRASKVPTPAQFRAKVNARRGGVSRRYPVFVEGMSTAQYVRDFYMANATKTGYSRLHGAFLSAEDIAREEAAIKRLYEPLSANPQFSPVDEVVEEIL